MKDPEQSIPLLEKFVSQTPDMDDREEILKEESSREEEDIEMM
jgi:hypothetical protein